MRPWQEREEKFDEENGSHASHVYSVIRWELGVFCLAERSEQDKSHSGQARSVCKISQASKGLLALGDD